MRRAIGLPALSLLSVAFVLCCSITSPAQNREKFVISAKAGGINAITGQASVHAKGETDWQTLMITDDLEAGDRVRTASDGRVEILLNPGSYLRVGSNSEVELADNTLSNLEVRLIRGTAIVEATGADGLELNINISTPHTNFAIVRQGLYRLNVIPGDGTELIVRKGRVILNDSHTKVKGGNKVVFSATTVSVAKLTKEEKKNEQDVDVWSKQRAQTLAQANKRINNGMLASAFNTYGDLGPVTRTSMGLWFYNIRVGCYTFLPFFYGWSSPYGGNYSTSVFLNYSPSRQSVGWHNDFPSRTDTSGRPIGETGPTTGAIPSNSSSRDGAAPAPRMIDPDTGARMPRKNIEPMRPNQ